MPKEINLLGPKADDSLWRGRLVADTRLRLANIFGNKNDEKFFRNMYDIVKHKIHYGYRTVAGKDVELKGIKDFLYNKKYGLGVLDIREFMLKMTKASLADKSEDEIVHRFLIWLKKQDKMFDLSPEYCEYKRLQMSLKQQQIKKKIPDQKYKTSWGVYKYSVLKTIYRVRPELLQHIGEDRKFKDIEEAAFEAGIIAFNKKPKCVSTIRFYDFYTKKDSIKLAKQIYAALGPVRSKQLIRNLLNYQQQQEHVLNLDEQWKRTYAKRESQAK